MSELMIFSNHEFGEVRTMEVDNNPWFVGKDVALALGYSDTKSALADHVNAEDKQIIQKGQIATLDIPNRGLTIINESGLYALIFGSKLESAKRFKHWVTSEVLPSIRKHGGYISGQESMSPEELMAKALMVAQHTLAEREIRISQLTVQNQIMAPKAEYFDDLVERNTLTNFRETAKELGTPPKKFVQLLLDKKYIYRDKKGKLLPFENRNDGLFEVKECVNDKTKWSGTQTLITPKGRETFRLLFL